MLEATHGRVADPSLLGPILIGYDGSRSSRRALAYACGVARRARRPLLVAHVVSPYTDYESALPNSTAATLHDDSLAWLRSEASGEIDVDSVPLHLAAAHGRRARALARVAELHRAEALVIGAPEHRLHLAFGSVPGWLGRHARCPVIVVL